MSCVLVKSAHLWRRDERGRGHSVGRVDPHVELLGEVPVDRLEDLDVEWVPRQLAPQLDEGMARGHRLGGGLSHGTSAITLVMLGIHASLVVSVSTDQPYF